jgi:uncharacterized protein (TIGR02300 family)
MPEVKLGTKHTCYSCGTKFYDLGRGKPTCPKCGANQDDAEAAANHLANQAARRKRKADPKPKVVKKAADEDDLEGEAIDDEELEADLADDDLPVDLGTDSEEEKAEEVDEDPADD